MNMSKIYLQYDNKSKYPEAFEYYNPSKIYPEYPWSKKDIAIEQNHPYEMVRECLYGMGYDKENFGKKEWDPLGEIISEGNTVLLKPNWVSHKNHNLKIRDNLSCLVTHPAIVRAILDYVVIALNKTGLIIIGDAPMQGTDLKALFELSGYTILFEFIKSKGINVKIEDFREYYTVEKHGVMSQHIKSKNNFESHFIDLKEQSFHAEKDSRNNIYKVSDYLSSETKQYHDYGKHQYIIDESVLLADVIINIPKPKTHRLAGFTAAMKNFVGIVNNKASLPHRNEGASETGKGDAYQKDNVFKKMMFKFEEREIQFSNCGCIYKAHISKYFSKLFFLFAILSGGDKYRIGSWYGNDTIWRTILDLQKIVLFADKNGNIKSDPQRKIVNVGDMIVCGEKNGPISPSPKYLGIIMISENSVLFDYVVCKIMGFNAQKIPTLWQAMKRGDEDYSKVVMKTNIDIFNGKKIENISFDKNWQFIPHENWK